MMSEADSEDLPSRLAGAEVSPGQSEQSGGSPPPQDQMVGVGSYVAGFYVLYQEEDGALDTSDDIGTATDLESREVGRS